MSVSFLETKDDFEWLRDVHGVNAFTGKHQTKRAECALLHGNEDAPDKIELYEKNKFDSKPFRVYIYDDETEKLVIQESTTQPLKIVGFASNVDTIG